MKKSVTFLVLAAVTLLGFSLISPVLAHGSGDETPNLPGDIDHMGFQDRSDHMTIDGSISVEDKITLTISVTPTDDMQNQMQDHHGSMNYMEDYTNSLEVSLFSLAEYEDNSSDGYSLDDTIVSTYPLDSSTLKQPVFYESNNTYIIESTDTNIFRMYIVFNTDADQRPFAFKWSVDINYPFASTNSNLAMLHQISSNEMMQRYGELGQGETHRYYQQNQMSDMDNHLPMFFRWDTTAIVDGEVTGVTATSVEDTFALSIPQGNHIVYDPEVGVDPESLAEANSAFDTMLGDFLATLQSPTVIALLLGSATLISLVILVQRQT